MKRTAWDFGSSWYSGRRAKRLDESAETTCDSQYDYLGFRLTHDDADRVYRGGSWNGTADRARAAYRRWSSPGYRRGLLGFRLVREEK